MSKLGTKILISSIGAVVLLSGTGIGLYFGEVFNNNENESQLQGPTFETKNIDSLKSNVETNLKFSTYKGSVESNIEVSNFLTSALENKNFLVFLNYSLIEEDFSDSLFEILNSPQKLQTINEAIHNNLLMNTLTILNDDRILINEIIEIYNDKDSIELLNRIIKNSTITNFVEQLSINGNDNLITLFETIAEDDEIMDFAIEIITNDSLRREFIDGISGEIDALSLIPIVKKATGKNTFNASIFAFKLVSKLATPIKNVMNDNKIINELEILTKGSEAITLLESIYNNEKLSSLFTDLLTSTKKDMVQSIIKITESKESMKITSNLLKDEEIIKVITDILTHDSLLTPLTRALEDSDMQHIIHKAQKIE